MLFCGYNARDWSFRTNVRRLCFVSVFVLTLNIAFMAIPAWYTTLGADDDFRLRFLDTRLRFPQDVNDLKGGISVDVDYYDDDFDPYDDYSPIIDDYTPIIDDYTPVIDDYTPIIDDNIPTEDDDWLDDDQTFGLWKACTNTYSDCENISKIPVYKSSKGKFRAMQALEILSVLAGFATLVLYCQVGCSRRTRSQRPSTWMAIGFCLTFFEFAAIVITFCISATMSLEHYTHNVWWYVLGILTLVYSCTKTVLASATWGPVLRFCRANISSCCGRAPDDSNNVEQQQSLLGEPTAV